MVRILPNGDIVPDNDQRERPISSGLPRNRHQIGGVAGNQDPVAHMPQASIFETFNQKLLDLGIPRWNVGSYTVEPIVTVGFLFALLLMGLPGLLFAGILFLVVQYSGGGSSSAHGQVRGNRNTDGQSPQGPPGRGGRADRGWSSGGGNRLGRS